VFTARYALNPYITPFFLDSRPLKMGRIGGPERMVRNYHYSLRNNPEDSSLLLFLYKAYRKFVLHLPFALVARQSVSVYYPDQHNTCVCLDNKRILKTNYFSSLKG
jgi:hypothetical protein